MARMPPRTGTQTCHVVPAASIVARLGANMGDGLDSDCAPEPGDIYVLLRGARTRRLVTRHGEPPRVASGSEVGADGEAVRGSLSLMLIAPTGDMATVSLLRFEQGSVMALVDGVMEPGIEYTLVSTEALREPMFLADVAPFGLGRGTRVLVGEGIPRPVEHLRAGDVVFTRDRGPQPLRDVVQVTLKSQGPQAPVVVPAGAIGNSGDLVLAREQRLHLYLRAADGARNGPEVLARAEDLVGSPGAFLQSGGMWTCHGLVFDRHEIIYAECLAVESLPASGSKFDQLPREAKAAFRARHPGFSQPLLALPDAPAGAAPSLLADRAGRPPRPAHRSAQRYSG